jgi:hypothetical protein
MTDLPPHTFAVGRLHEAMRTALPRDEWAIREERPVLKWRRYAAASIPIDMIVRLKGPDALLEVWTGPTGRGKAARYTDVVRYSARAGESVPIEVDGREQDQIAVVDLVARLA